MAVKKISFSKFQDGRQPMSSKSTNCSLVVMQNWSLKHISCPPSLIFNLKFLMNRTLEMICIIVPNFMEIDRTDAEILQCFFAFLH